MARVRIKTYGCTHNQADSEVMSGLLAAAGHELVDYDEELLLINSCAVKDPAEQKFRHDIRTSKVPVVVAGCVVQGNPRDALLQEYSGVGVKDIDRIVEVVEATMKGEVKRLVTRRRNPSLSLPRAKGNPLIRIIPINSGCLGTCTYCKTVQARGRLESHPVAKIIEAIEAAVDEGVREIWLTSEDVGAYGKDIGTELLSLLERIAALRGSFMVRVGMANPEHILPIIDDLCQLFLKHPKRFFRFLHIPVQAGSDEVLKQMARPYTVDEFEKLLERARQAIPDITIMNDYIVGFPSESEEEFAKTLDLVRTTECRILNINKFYPRPGTRAARMRLLPTKVVARRCKELVAIYESMDPNEGMVGARLKAFFTQQGKAGSIVGHTANYTQVVLKGSNDALREALGSWVEVKVVAEKKYYLTAERSKESSNHTSSYSSKSL